MPDYTLQYVYQMSDFNIFGNLIAPPNAIAGQADAPTTFQMALHSGVVAQHLKVTDDDSFFDDLNIGPQISTVPITLDGVTYPAGSQIVVTYVIDTKDGFDGFAFHLSSGAPRSHQTTGFVTNQKMTTGQTYTFKSKTDANPDAIPHSEFACFTAGTLIKTDMGERAIEIINAGDRVMTRDHGMQTVRWVGSRTVPAFGDLAPIAFEAGTLGCSTRLMVSPNHRMLISGAMAELVCGDPEMLICAKLLVNDRNVHRMSGGLITYVHIMFDYHEVIWANDCPSERFYAGDQAINSLNTEQAREILVIFLELRSGTKKQSLARAEACGYEGIVISASL